MTTLSSGWGVAPWIRWGGGVAGKIGEKGKGSFVVLN